MTVAARYAVLVALVGSAFLAAGCGGDSCSISPEIRDTPDSCILGGDRTVTVNVRWCSCSATTTCDVRIGEAGIIELEPSVDSCDASCETNPTSCPADTVPCTFDMPASGYNTLLIHGALDFEEVPLTISGTNTVCS